MSTPRPSRRATAAMVATVAALTAAYTFGVRPLQATQADAAGKEHAAQSKLDAQRAQQLALGAGGKAYLAKVYQAAVRAEATLPDSAALVEADLPRLVAAQGLTLTALTRADDIAAGQPPAASSSGTPATAATAANAGAGLAHTPFTLTATGSMASVRNFVQVVEAHPQLISLSDVQIVMSGNTASLTTTLKVWHTGTPLLPDPAKPAPKRTGNGVASGPSATRVG